MDNQFQILNSIYQPIQEYLHNLLNIIKSLEFEYHWNYYNNHSVMRDKEWALEYYPIPVITIKNLCDIGIDIDHIFIECKISKDHAMNIDWNSLLPSQFAVYGVADYLQDIHNSSMSIETIYQRINVSSEQELSIEFTVDYLEDCNTLIEIIHIIQQLKNN